jgi:hypothetical protein
VHRPPDASTFASTSSIESTSTVLRGCVKSSLRFTSAPPFVPLGPCHIG